MDTPRRPLSCGTAQALRAGPVVLAFAASLVLVVGARGAHADVLETKDGRFIEGLVLEAEDHYIVFSRFGPSEVAKADVAKRVRERPVDEQVRDHVQRIPATDLAGRVRLATWLQGLGREDEARTIAEAMLAIDPEHAEAHGLLGHVRHHGRWMSPDDAKRADGLERHGDCWYTPEEWKSLSGADRVAAEEAARRQEAAARAREVQRMLSLATSPDPAVRQRARAKLERLAEEANDDTLKRLLPALDDYVQRVEEVKAKAARYNESVMTGTVLGEFRVTLTRLKRPIREFVTNLASGPIGANAPVTLQLPELEVITVRTTGIIPVVGP